MAMPPSHPDRSSVIHGAEALGPLGARDQLGTVNLITRPSRHRPSASSEGRTVRWRAREPPAVY